MLLSHAKCEFELQMLPLLKKSIDNLMAVLGEKARSEETFDALQYVFMSHK